MITPSDHGHTLPDALLQRLGALLSTPDQANPALLIGENSRDILRRALCAHTDSNVDAPGHQPGADVERTAESGLFVIESLVDTSALQHLVDANRRFANALVSHTLERLDQDTGGHVLALLRDRLCERFTVMISNGADAGHHQWRSTDFIALGMRREVSDGRANPPYSLYSFNIGDYKTTPDWLNADHWANPHLFGKVWW